MINPDHIRNGKLALFRMKDLRAHKDHVHVERFNGAYALPSHVRPFSLVTLQIDLRESWVSPTVLLCNPDGSLTQLDRHGIVPNTQAGVSDVHTPEYTI